MKTGFYRLRLGPKGIIVATIFAMQNGLDTPEVLVTAARWLELLTQLPPTLSIVIELPTLLVVIAFAAFVFWARAARQGRFDKRRRD